MAMDTTMAGAATTADTTTMGEPPIAHCLLLACF